MPRLQQRINQKSRKGDLSVLSHVQLHHAFDCVAEIIVCQETRL